MKQPDERPSAAPTPLESIESDHCDLIIVLTTVANPEDAERLSAHLVGCALAACVQTEGPIRSQYHWDSVLHSDREYRLVIKTSSACWQPLHDELLRIHPYDEPQLIRISVDGASAGYHGWVMEQTRRCEK